MKDHFESIAKAALPNVQFIALPMCPDEVVGKVQLGLRGIQFLGSKFLRHKNLESAISKPNVVLVIESPHVCEYSDLGVALGPANGKTGEFIRKQFGTATSDLSFDNDFRPLVLVNAIPFQCSLGKPTWQFRDQVFRAAWPDESIGRSYFIKRLSSVINNNSILINCCTKGKGPGELRELVHDAISEVDFKGRYLRGVHPSAWWREDARLIDHSQWSKR